jgi:tetratricopeptide (TPR) repeat protein
VLRRARDFERAQDIAERALQKGGGAEARQLRAELAKARGDRDSALADFELLCDAVDDPKLRLELAKLYEHHARSPQRALQLLERGTGESVDATERRRVRLQRKLQTSRHR